MAKIAGINFTTIEMQDSTQAAVTDQSGAGANPTDIKLIVKSMEFSDSADELDVTGLGQNTRQYERGLADWEATLTLVMDPAVTVPVFGDWKTVAGSAARKFRWQVGPAGSITSMDTSVKITGFDTSFGDDGAIECTATLRAATAVAPVIANAALKA